MGRFKFSKKPFRLFFLMVIDLISILSFGTSQAALAQTSAFAQTSLEYKVKGAFLFNFAKFIDWPNETTPPESNTFNLCVLGGNPFDDFFEDIERTKKIKKMNFKVKYLDRCCEFNGCKILYFTPSWKGDFQKVLSGLRNRPVLTVGEAPDFTRNGGMIQFFEEGNQLRFEINVSATKQAKLDVSSQLLNLAKITEENE